MGLLFFTYIVRACFKEKISELEPCHSQEHEVALGYGLLNEKIRRSAQ